MEIIKLENQKYDSFFEAECFLCIGEAKEDEIFNCFDGQDYCFKCYENEVTNDEKLKNEILGNYDILRNSTIRYLKEIVHKNKINFSKKLGRVWKLKINDIFNDYLNLFY